MKKQALKERVAEVEASNVQLLARVRDLRQKLDEAETALEEARAEAREKDDAPPGWVPVAAVLLVAGCVVLAAYRIWLTL
jgi:cytochrome c-type biogenesis protein CcmH/NrfG